MAGKHERVHLRERHCKDGSISLQLDFCRKGKRYRVSTGLFLTGDEAHDRNTRDLAAELRNNKENELLQIERGIIRPSHKGDVTSVRDYALKIANTKDKPSSKQNYLNLAKKVPKDLMLADVSRSNFSDILVMVYPPKCKVTTKHLYGTILRAVLKKAYDDGYLEKEPNLKGLIPRPQKGNKEFLTESEIIQLQSVNAPELESTKRLFLFSINTGLRISDLETLKWEDIVNNRIVKQQVKTERTIRIPLNDNALALMPTKQDTGLVFEPIPRNTLERRLKVLCKKAGIEKHITFHCARVTCATQLLSRGTDVYTVSRILGHTDIKTTIVYLRLLDESLVKAVNTLDNIGTPSPEPNFAENVLDFNALLNFNKSTGETPLTAKEQQ